MKYTLLIAFITAFNFIYSQTTGNIVTLTTSGTGKTIEEAKNNALRSAIEQAFGAFISSKTEILNDEIVSDQITSVSSGNIQSFEIKIQEKLPNESWAITITSIVSIDKLISFVQTKGVAVEIKGSLFALNVKQQVLNEKAEINNVISIIGNMHLFMQNSFDNQITASEPRAINGENDKWSILLKVVSRTNINYNASMDYLCKSLENISLSENEIQDYSSHGKKVYKVWIQNNGKINIYSLRKLESIKMFDALCYNITNYYPKSFRVSWGTDQFFTGFQFINEKDDYGYDKRGFKLVPMDYKSRMAYGFPNFNPEGVFITLDIPVPNSIVGNYILNHSVTLNELENISGYEVNTTKSSARFEYGGYVFAEREYYQVKLLLKENSHSILTVIPNGPADLAGLKENDSIIRINSKPLVNGNIIDLVNSSVELYKKSTFEVMRNGEVFSLEVTPKPVKYLIIASPITFNDSALIAIQKTSILNQGGYDDWTLPTANEMKLLRQRITDFGIVNLPQQILEHGLTGKLDKTQTCNRCVDGHHEFYWCKPEKDQMNFYSGLEVNLRHLVTFENRLSPFEIFKVKNSEDANLFLWKAEYIPVRYQIIEN
jgi:hypothetical protein